MRRGAALIWVLLLIAVVVVVDVVDSVVALATRVVLSLVESPSLVELLAVVDSVVELPAKVVLSSGSVVVALVGLSVLVALDGSVSASRKFNKTSINFCMALRSSDVKVCAVVPAISQAPLATASSSTTTNR